MYVHSFNYVHWILKRTTHCLGVLIILFAISHSRDLEYDYVTCGSAIKMMNVALRSRLHSHEVKYGSGSGQQSVTGVEAKDDVNSHWQIRGKMGEKACVRGEPVKCGATVRLNHVTTGKNLHSHLFKSPISRYQEVSCFGEDGEGDTGDNWIVVCDDDYWRRDEPVRLKHVDTSHYLHMTGDTFNRPIAGQREVSAYPNPHNNNQWKVAEGIYIKPSEEFLGFKPAVYKEEL